MIIRHLGFPAGRNSPESGTLRRCLDPVQWGPCKSGAHLGTSATTTDTPRESLLSKTRTPDWNWKICRGHRNLPFSQSHTTHDDPVHYTLSILDIPNYLTSDLRSPGAFLAFLTLSVFCVQPDSCWLVLTYKPRNGDLSSFV